MKKNSTDEQIIEFLRNAAPSVGLSRGHCLSEARSHLRDVPDAKRQKTLEAENVRLKELLAESMIENEVMRQAFRKRW